MGSSSGLIALLAAGVGLAVLLWIFLRRTGDSVRRMDLLLSQTAAAREAAQGVDRRFEEMRRSVEDRVLGLEGRLAEGQKSLTEHLGASGRALADVGQRMGQIFEAARKIEALATDVTRLEDLLKPPKLRGALGETFLEQVLRQVLPQKCWTMQYRFPDNVVVDAAIFVGERLVPVDSKFPLENYRRSREASDEGERRRALREFAADVRRQVDAIRTRYIRPENGTYDFALMYVPAEAVYCEIAGDGEQAALADYAMERRVVPVSPRLLYAYLATVAQGLRGLELQQSAQEVQARLADLARLWERVEEPFDKIRGHVANTQKQYDEAAKALSRFGQKLSAIAEGASEQLDDGRLAAVPLFPPG